MTVQYNCIIKDKINLIREETENGRFYYLESEPDKKYPSVTTFLSWTETAEKKKGLADWRKKVGDAEADRVLDKSTSLGNEIHQQFENHFLGNKNGNFSFKSKIMFQTGLAYLEPQVTGVYGCELACLSRELGLAGTSDFVVDLNGIPTVVDFKNSRKQKKKEWIKNYFLQSTAYGKMLYDTYQVPIRNGLILIMNWDGILTPFHFEMKQYYDELKQLVKRKNEYANFD